MSSPHARKPLSLESKSRAPESTGKQLQRQLGERYLQILDAIHDMILVKGPRSRIVWANRAFREYYGMSNEQLENIIDAPFNEPSYTEQYVRDDAYVLETGKVLDIPHEPVTRYDGVVRTFHTVKSPIADSYGKVIMTVGVSRDITDHEAQEKIINEQRIEMARQKGEAQYHAIFDMMLEGLAIGEILYDENGQAYDYRYIDVNPGYERFTGIPASQVRGRTLYEVFPDSEPDWLRNFAQVAATGIPIHTEGWFGPLKKWFEVSALRIDSRRFAVIFFDISGRKATEAALLAAKEAAESAIRIKARFLDVTAHELRTPVTAFNLLIQHSQNQLEKKGIQIDLGTLRRLRGQAERLSHLVIDLLEASRLERGLVQLKRKPTEIGALASECIATFRIQTPTRRISLSQPESPSKSDIDPLRIYQVISNLLDNAIKYTPGDTPIEVRVEETSHSTRVSVQDHGSGIPEKQQSLLFSPVSRALSDQDERSSGLGLGLYISREIIGLHGGTMSVQSQLGQGSTFSFELPNTGRSS